MSDSTPQPTTKQCPKCKDTFPLTAEYFYRDRTRQSGFDGLCKSCRSVGHGHTPRRRFPEAPEGFKYCLKCGDLKPIDGFNKHKKSKNGILAVCRECRGIQPHLQHGVPDGYKRCGKCRKVLPKTNDYFVYSSGAATSTCKSCSRMIIRRWGNKSPEKRKAINARYRIKNAQKIKEHWHKNRERYRVVRLARYRANREAINEQRRQKYAQNPEPKRAYSRAWYYAHQEYYRAYSKERYQQNRAASLSRTIAWRRQHPDKANEYNRIWHSRNPHLTATYNATRRAKRKALPNTMTYEDTVLMLRYWRGCCVITGLKGKLHIDHWIPITSPDCPGTIPTNLVPMLASLNLSKNDSNAHEWLVKRFGEEQAAVIEKRVMDYFDWLRSRESV